MDGRGLVGGDLAFFVAGEGRFHVLMIVARRRELGVLCLKETDAFGRRGELHVHLTQLLKRRLVLGCGARFCCLSGALSGHTSVGSGTRGLCGGSDAADTAGKGSESGL
jgi:hypothetical protein